MNRTKSWRIALAVGLIGNLLISISFFSYLSDTSEVGGALSATIQKVEMTFSAAFCTALGMMLFQFVLKKFWSDENKLLAISMMIFGASFYLNQKICDNIYYEGKPHTKSVDEIKSIYDDRFIKNQKEFKKKYNSAEIFSPPLIEKIKDKMRLSNGIKSILNFFQGGNQKKTEADSTRGVKYIEYINLIFDMNYDNADTNTFKLLADSFKIEFMAYSPDFKYFVSVFTFRQNRSFSPEFCYWSGILLCEKHIDSLVCHSFSSDVIRDGDYIREAAYLNGFLALDYFGYNFGLRNNNSKLVSPLNREFWISETFFKPTSTPVGILPRYQAQESFQSNHYKQRRPVVIK